MYGAVNISAVYPLADKYCIVTMTEGVAGLVGVVLLAIC
jgi:hypothetical protein